MKENKSSKSPQELAEITIKQYTEQKASSNNSFDNELIKFDVVFRMFKHCLIFSFNINEYIKHLLLLDNSFDIAIWQVLQDFPEFKIKNGDNLVSTGRRTLE